MSKKYENFINYIIILTLLFFFIGITLIFFPQVTILSISYIISLCFISLGAILVLYSMKELFFLNFLSFGVLQMVLGLIILIYPYALTTIIPISIGVWMILKSTIDFRMSLLLKKSKADEWIYVSILSLLSIVCGIMLIIKTEIGNFSPEVVIGLFLTANCLSAIIDAYIFKDNIKCIVNYVNTAQKN